MFFPDQVLDQIFFKQAITTSRHLGIYSFFSFSPPTTKKQSSEDSEDYTCCINTSIDEELLNHVSRCQYICMPPTWCYLMLWRHLRREWKGFSVVVVWCVVMMKAANSSCISGLMVNKNYPFLSSISPLIFTATYALVTATLSFSYYLWWTSHYQPIEVSTYHYTSINVMPNRGEFTIGIQTLEVLFWVNVIN